jgi:hypothetical protein
MIYSGDTVNVYFEHCSYIYNAKVVYVPSENEVDSWFVLESEAGSIIFVKNFAYMEKIT